MRKYRSHKISGHPRKIFLRDLKKFILQYQTNSHEIILGIDSNSTGSDPDFITFLNKCNLFDLLYSKHKDSSHTHNKGNRLDYIFGTHFIREYMTSIGILGSDYGAISDHSAIFLDLDTSIFERSNDPTPISARGIFTKHRRRFLKYGATVNEILQQDEALKNLLQQLDIVSPSDLPTLCNAIDNIITQALLDQENKFRNVPFIQAWSPAYQTACKTYANARRYL